MRGTSLGLSFCLFMTVYRADQRQASRAKICQFNRSATARFKARQANPAKQWKITDEDWRNREKWDLYEEAIDEMLAKTSTKNAPWYIIESNDKKYARIRTLKIIVDALEKACEGQLNKETK